MLKSKDTVRVQGSRVPGALQVVVYVKMCGALGKLLWLPLARGPRGSGIQLPSSLLTHWRHRVGQGALS